jgi:hypothetical protein
LAASAACVALIALSNQNLSSNVRVSHDQGRAMPKEILLTWKFSIACFRSIAPSLHSFSIDSKVHSHSNTWKTPVSSFDSASSVNWLLRKRGIRGTIVQYFYFVPEFQEHKIRPGDVKIYTLMET